MGKLQKQNIMGKERDDENNKRWTERESIGEEKEGLQEGKTRVWRGDKGEVTGTILGKGKEGSQGVTRGGRDRRL